MREAVCADIGPRERARAHARAADILAASGASEERIAAQIAEADPIGHPGRVELLRRVATDALVRGAPAAAAASLTRALAEPPPPASRAAVLVELGAVEYRLARPEAVDHLTSAMGLIRDPRPLGTKARWLALALTLAGNSYRAVEVIESVVGVIEPDDRELALLLEAELFAHAQMASVERRAPAAMRLERYADLPGATPGERLVLASLACERARARSGARTPDVHRVARPRHRGRRPGPHRRIGRELHADADVALDLAAAHDVLEDACHRLVHRIPRLGDILLHANPAGHPDAHDRTNHHRATVTAPAPN